MDPYVRTSCSFGGLLTLAGIVFLAMLAWNDKLTIPALGFLAVWLTIGIGLLFWGLRQVRDMTRERRIIELMSLTYAVIGVPAMLATAGFFMLAYIALATSATSSADSITPLEFAGFITVLVVGLIVGGFGVGAFLTATLGKRLLGLARADFEALSSWSGFSPLDRFYQRMLDFLYGRFASTTSALREDPPYRKVRLISLRNIFIGIVMGLLSLAVFGWLIIVSSDLLPAAAQTWVRSCLPQIITFAMVAFIIAVVWYQHRRQTRYRPGDNPLSQARIMLAFGRRSMAIRYLEDALRHNPSSADNLAGTPRASS